MMEMSVASMEMVLLETDLEMELHKVHKYLDNFQ